MEHLPLQEDEDDFKAGTAKPLRGRLTERKDGSKRWDMPSSRRGSGISIWPRGEVASQIVEDGLCEDMYPYDEEWMW